MPPDPGHDSNTRSPATGLTLAGYAAAKKLPLAFLRELGLSDVQLGHPAVRIPYFDALGNEVAVRFRTALGGPERFRWRRRSRPCLYGLGRLADTRQISDALVLVEGESDAQTLWWHGIAAVGIPGASTWQDAWAEALDGFSLLYVVVEPDRGGQTLHERFRTSRLRDRLRVIALTGAKDPSELYLRDPAGFPAAWHHAVQTATPWVRVSAMVNAPIGPS